MIKIVVLSDTHGNQAAIDKIMPVLQECDMIIHLGDTSQDGSRIRSQFPQKTKLLNGNCDFMQFGEDELVLGIENVKILACHGHRYSVKCTLDKLAYRAKELECSLALYGHTHQADEREIDGVTLINPGNMSRYSKNSYCYLVINNDKAVHKIVYADERN